MPVDHTGGQAIGSDVAGGVNFIGVDLVWLVREMAVVAPQDDGGGKGGIDFIQDKPSDVVVVEAGRDAMLDAEVVAITHRQGVGRKCAGVGSACTRLVGSVRGGASASIAYGDGVWTAAREAVAGKGVGGGVQLARDAVDGEGRLASDDAKLYDVGTIADLLVSPQGWAFVDDDVLAQVCSGIAEAHGFDAQSMQARMRPTDVE